MGEDTRADQQSVNTDHRVDGGRCEAKELGLRRCRGKDLWYGELASEVPDPGESKTGS